MKRLKPSLLEGASTATLARMVTAAFALGVTLPSAAQAQTTVNPVQATTYNISPSSNPITFGSGTNLTGGAYGANTTQWNITNQGSIAGNGAPGGLPTGIFLNGSGASGAAGGTVTNQTGGSISGAKYGVEVAGATGSVTNAGTITVTSPFGSGVDLASGGTVTNQTGGSISVAKYGVKVTGGTGSVTNAGTIAAAIKDGVYLGAGGTVANNANGVISGGRHGVYVYGGSGTVTNAGKITGSGGDGVLLAAGGSVANQAGGAIKGSTYGVQIQGASGTVTNAGTITGTSKDGVNLAAGGTVANYANGVISGGRNGVYVNGGSGTVTNAGQITGSGGDGVLLAAGGSVANQAGGAIKGGVQIQGASGTLTNAGTITGTSKDGVNLAAGGTVANYANGVISGGGNGVYVNGGSGTVTNAGQIIGTANSDFGVALAAGGTVTNQTGGYISGSAGGVGIGGASGTVTNAGTITGTGSGPGSHFGVLLAAGGTVTNQTGGSISGAKYGVKVAGGSGTVTNAGAITGAFGVYLASGGTVTNQTDGSISGGLGIFATGGTGSVTNAGKITGTLLGVGLLSGGSVTNQTGGVINGYLGVLIRGASGSVTNAGSITGQNYMGVYLGAGGSVTNQAGGSITGAIYGVLIQGASGTVTNAGSITGQSYTGVYLGAGGSVTNKAGGSIKGSAYGVLIEGGAGSVTNAGVITGADASVVFGGSGANVLTLQTGSVLKGPAVGSTAAGATNTLVLQGSGEADNVFLNFQTLAVQATGTWTLGGTNGIGSTEVASGTLLVNGALTSTTTTVNGGTLEIGDQAHAFAQLTSAVTVNAGGVLAGHGMIAGNVTNNGGVVSPGGTVGMLTINGDYAQSAGGVLSIEVSPANSSQLQVTGKAALAGSLQLVADPGIYRKGTTFDVLNATTISGDVSAATANNGMQIAAEVRGQELLAVVTQGVAPLAAGATRNEHAVANAFANYPVGTSDFDPVANAIVGMSAGAQQNGAFDKLGGEVYADLLAAGRDSARAFLGALSDQMSADASSGAGGGKTAVWGRAFGSFGSVVGDANTHGYSNNAGGAIFGVEHHLSGDTVLGASASYGRTDISLRGLAQTGDLDTGAIALYGEHRSGMVFVDGALSYDYDHGQGDRTIALPGVAARRASSGFSGDVFGGLLEAGLRFERAGFVWQPSMGVLYSQVNQDGFTESGAGGANLAVASRSLNAAESLAGVRFSRILYANGGKWKFDGRLAWTHERGALTPTIDERFAAASGTNFALAGARLNSDSGVIGAGLTYNRSANLSFYARYQGVLGQHETQNAFTLGARFAW